MSILQVVEALKHLPGQHDQASHNPYKGGSAVASQSTTAQDIPGDIRGKSYYHSVSTTAVGEDILKDGFIEPRQDVSHMGAWMAPVVGRVYLAQGSQDDLLVGHTLGAMMQGHELMDWQKEAGRYGYIFEVSGEDFQDIQPDEDAIGEMLYEGPQWLKDKAKNLMAPHTFRKASEGEYPYVSKAGKILAKRLSDAQKFELIRLGASVAHAGHLPIRRAWRVDKERQQELSGAYPLKKGDIWNIAVEVPVPGAKLKHLPGMHDQKSHTPKTYGAGQGAPKKDWTSLIPVHTVEDARMVLAGQFETVGEVGGIDDATLINLANGAAKLPPEMLNRVAMVVLRAEEGENFVAGGQTFKTGGNWVVANAEVDIYDANSKDANDFANMLGHEAGHAVNDEWWDRANSEEAAAFDEHPEWFDHSGNPKNEYRAQYKDACPLRMAQAKFLTAWRAGQDGITPYSEAWAKDGKWCETVAEMAKSYMAHHDFAKRYHNSVADAERSFTAEMKDRAPGLGAAFLDAIHALRNVEPLWMGQEAQI